MSEPVLNALQAATKRLKGEILRVCADAEISIQRITHGQAPDTISQELIEEGNRLKAIIRHCRSAADNKPTARKPTSRKSR